MALSFNDAEQEAAFSAHLDALQGAELAHNWKGASMAAADAAMLLLRAPTTGANEAEHQRLRELWIRYRGML